MWATSKAGFLVIGPAGKLICANAEGLQILAYPQAPAEMGSLEDSSSKLRGLLSGQRAPSAESFANISSGRRCYVCCVIRLVVPATDAPAEFTAVRIERKVQGQDALRRLSQEFKLTPRERESVGLLAQGLTNKEIAQRMCLSANTVKTLLHLVMTKMAVPNRSAVVAKLVELAQPPQGGSF